MLAQVIEESFEPTRLKIFWHNLRKGLPVLCLNSPGNEMILWDLLRPNEIVSHVRSINALYEFDGFYNYLTFMRHEKPSEPALDLAAKDGIVVRAKVIGTTSIKLVNRVFKREGKDALLPIVISRDDFDWQRGNFCYATRDKAKEFLPLLRSDMGLFVVRRKTAHKSELQLVPSLRKDSICFPKYVKYLEKQYEVIEAIH